ncbi:branched-chain amino acid ABC transporter ATP-binding protein/permease [Hydrogenophaga sp. YM1]|uniref:branched-chain amino acid ABC transporter ATP-binding protein/permease n=1 Tax=Hydrogenophaga sp. YM1 TaxID=2806262 RepID=UPI001EF52145|nr:branched-chain amino acid ABC transporter ATP-binding protein/permease [Hydrogenophaga sp. YM1]
MLPLKGSWLTTLSYIGIYALPALGLVLITGTAGMLSFGQAAFMGLGAYTTALVVGHLDWSPWLGLLAGWALTAACAWILGAVTLPMSGHYLPIATLAWGLALSIAFANLEILGRNDGLSGIVPLSIGGMSLQSQVAMFYVIWTVVLLALLLARNLLDSRPGRAIRSLLGGQMMPESMGIDTVSAKRTAFVIAALLSSTGGWLYAHMIRAVSPSAFSPMYSLEFVFMAVIGGATSIWGSIVGAAIVVFTKDGLQTYLPKLLPLSGNAESVVLGVAMVLLLIKTREGLWPYLARRFGLGTRRLQVAASFSGFAPRSDAVNGGHLVVNGATKRFGGLVAVNKVSLEVRPSEIVALIGPNGAGKSTTFNLITGVLPMNEGEVIFNGSPISNATSRSIAKAGIFRTFQHVKLLPAMSVLENIAIGAHLESKGNVFQSVLRLDRSEEAAILANAAEQGRRVGLGDCLHLPAGSLSLGQQRLIEIARGLAGNPSMLLLDEPAAGLRFAEKVALGKLLSELKQNGVSILLVEHDMQFVMELADRIFVLDFGTRIAEGTPAEIQCSDVVKRAYLGME